jgi:hypothetical protein
LTTSSNQYPNEMKHSLLLPEKILTLFIRSKFASIITANAYIASIALVLLVVLSSFPSYDVFLASPEKSEDWKAIFLQIKAPFIDHNHLYQHGSHAEKLAFRLIPALLLKATHVDTVFKAMLFQFASLILFYYSLTCLFIQLFQDKIKCFYYALPICFVIAGHVYCSDIAGFFDTLALSFLLIALRYRHHTLLLIPLLLAYFTDERALIVSPLILLINLFEKGAIKNTKAILHQTLSKPNLILVLSWVLYGIMRIGLAYAFTLHTGTGGLTYFFEQGSKTGYTLYIGLEGFIIAFMMSVMYLLKKRYITFTLLVLSNFTLIFIVSQSVIDINRSMSYVLLLIILLIMMLDKFFTTNTVKTIIAWTILINLLYDDFYPLFAQVYRIYF